MIWPEAHLPASELPRGQTSVPPINSAGYRGREPLDLGEVNILFIGDEWTEGSNINYENSFAAIVAKKLSLKTGKRIHEFNLGQEGKSYDYVSRILMCSLELMKPEFVLICFPPMGRREYFALDGRLIDFDPIKAAAIIRGEIDSDSIEREIIKNLHSIITKFDDLANALKNAALIEALLNDTGVDWAFGATSPGNENINELLSRDWLSEDRYIGSVLDPSSVNISNEEIHEQYGTTVCNWLIENTKTFAVEGD